MQITINSDDFKVFGRGVHVSIDEEKNKVFIMFDLDGDAGASKSGKSRHVAKTGGNVDIGKGLTLGMYCYK